MLHLVDIVQAPVKKGQKIGEAVISIPGVEDKKIDLIAGKDIAKLGLWGRFKATIHRVLP
jgi:D-alanyl-D-alanine carboxypeptidase